MESHHLPFESIEMFRHFEMFRAGLLWCWAKMARSLNRSDAKTLLWYSVPITYGFLFSVYADAFLLRMLWIWIESSLSYQRAGFWVCWSHCLGQVATWMLRLRYLGPCFPGSSTLCYWRYMEIIDFCFLGSSCYLYWMALEVHWWVQHVMH